MCQKNLPYKGGTKPARAETSQSENRMWKNFDSQMTEPYLWHLPTDAASLSAEMTKLQLHPSSEFFPGVGRGGLDHPWALPWRQR